MKPPSDKSLRVAVGARFAPGDRVRFKAKFLRNTGQISGDEAHRKWTVMEHDCPQCKEGVWVMVDQKTGDPETPYRHIASANLERAPGSKAKSAGGPSVFDAATEKHFKQWLENHVHDDEQHEVEMAIRELVTEHPDFLESHSWPEMRRLTEANLRTGTDLRSVRWERSADGGSKLVAHYDVVDADNVDCVYETRTIELRPGYFDKSLVEIERSIHMGRVRRNAAAPNKKVHKEQMEALGARCEQQACENGGSHAPGSCKKPAGAARTAYGKLCDSCAATMPGQHLLPPHGTARKGSILHQGAVYRLASAKSAIVISDDTGAIMAVGPFNTDGQATKWVRACQKNLKGFSHTARVVHYLEPDEAMEHL